MRAILIVGLACAAFWVGACGDAPPGPTEPRLTPAPEVTALSFEPQRVEANALPDGWRIEEDTLRGTVVLQGDLEDPLQSALQVRLAVVGVPPLSGTLVQGVLDGQNDSFSTELDLTIATENEGYYAIIVEPVAADGREGPPARATFRYVGPEEDTE